MSLSLTARDIDILLCLTLQVRLMTVKQIADVWWPDRRSLKPVQRRLQRLCWSGHLQMAVMNAHPLLPIHQPLAVWTPGEEAPDSEVLAQRTQDRWKKPAVPTTVCFATASSGNLSGARPGEILPSDEIDRDLHLASVFCHWRAHRTEMATRWICRRALIPMVSKVYSPEAFLLSPDMGRPVGVMDSAGRSKAPQIQRIHDYCSNANLPYELW